jgi:hypothetical protein
MGGACVWVGDGEACGSVGVVMKSLNIIELEAERCSLDSVGAFTDEHSRPGGSSDGGNESPGADGVVSEGVAS